MSIIRIAVYALQYESAIFRRARRNERVCCMHAAHTRYTSAAFRYNGCMAKKRIDRDKILQAFLTCAFEKSAGAVSLADIASLLGVNKASLYNHFSSRDEIYEAAIDFCAEYMSGVRFISESADSLVSLPFADALSKIVRQYFRSYEIEPLFQMYAFIHSSKFFSSKAAMAAEQEAQKIADDTASLIARFAENGKLPSAESKLCQNLAPDTTGTKDMNDTAADALKERALFFAREMSAELSSYIVEKKEMLRRNPESGAGSLFALPSDDSALAKIVGRALSYWTR